MTAATCGENEEAGRLLAAGLSPDEPGDDGGTALYRAAVQGHAALVRTLLAAGADPDRESAAEDEGLPLCAAACWGHLGAVTALLDRGADPAPAGGRGPLDAAREFAGRDAEAEVRALAGAYARPGARIGVRRERSEGGDVRVVAEVRDEAGELRSEHSLGTGHAEIVRLLESRLPGPPGGHPAS
ncbi:ankyrin repeat protein [Nonomuraea fuscirosea]|uniref:Ankyrin repeat protein n=1 Tax=Nonomuraea fuscirosea TaxID=1291556 RepID=A0A2T0NBN9_9ACTN|nr:ankyrin repeat protein [Nonomuraea fuscirosea]